MYLPDSGLLRGSVWTPAHLHLGGLPKLSQSVTKHLWEAALPRISTPCGSSPSPPPHAPPITFLSRNLHQGLQGSSWKTACGSLPQFLNSPPARSGIKDLSLEEHPCPFQFLSEALSLFILLYDNHLDKQSSSLSSTLRLWCL